MDIPWFSFTTKLTKDAKGRIFLTVSFVLFASFVVKFALPFLVAARGVRSSWWMFLHRKPP